MFFNAFIFLLLVLYLAILVVLFSRRLLHQKPQKPKRRSIPLDKFKGVNIIKILDLSKSFDHPVLNSISLSIKKGETVGILGQSGTGKSVLLKLIAGFLKPDRGQVLFKGQDIGVMSEDELLEVRKRMSYVFQHGAVFDFLDVGENIAYPLLEQGITDERAIQSRVAYLLDAVELQGMGNSRFNELSAGGKKQVAIARAIANNPEVILYDEPTTGVDPIIGKSLSRLIRKLNWQERLTSVVVTHDLHCMEIVADKIIILKDGEIRFEGDLAALKDSADSYVQAFIGGKQYEVDKDSACPVSI